MQERVTQVDVQQGAVAPPRGPANESSTTRPRRRVTPGSSSRFVAATEWLDDGTPVVALMGELDLATAPALERTLLDLADDRATTVIVDLRACAFIESSCLRVLIASERRLNRSARRLVVVVSNPCVLRVFEITGVDRFLAIYPSLGLALEGACRD